MMPSRGIQIGARAFRASQYNARLSARSYTVGPSRPNLHATARKAFRQAVTIEQRRNISYNPANWWPSGKTNAPPDFEAAHRATTPTTTSSPYGEQAAPPPAAPSAAEPSIATPESVNGPALTDVNALDLPTSEGIGYLKSLGLDYGWGPTSVLQWCLEHIHIYTGLPWWASIALTSAIFRVAVFPLTVRMSDSSARMSVIKPRLDEYQKKMVAAMRTQDTLALQTAQQEMSNLRLRAGVSFKWMGWSMLANMTLAICGLKMLRHMASLPVPGLLDGGALWFTNLTMADPYCAIPVLMGLALHANFRIGAEPGMELYQSPAARTLLLYGLPALVTFSMMWFSSAAVMWLASSGVVGLATGKLMMRPEFRERWNMAPLPKKGAAAATNPIMSGLFGDEAKAENKTIDVKGTRKEDSAKMTGGAKWQAPSQKSGNGGQMKAAPQEPPKSSDFLKYVSTSAKDSASAASSNGQKNFLAKYTSWGADRINDLGASYTAIGKQGRKLVKRLKDQAGNSDDAPESKTRSKEFMSQADEYEKAMKRVQERERQRKGRGR